MAANVLAAATGSTDGMGKIGTVPIAGTLFVRCPVSSKTTRVKWRVKGDKAMTVQPYIADGVTQTVTLTLASLADSETLIINGLTYTAKDAGSTVASRYFNTGGADATADAAALVAVINDAASGALGVTASNLLGVVTLVPSSDAGATVIQAVTGTAGAHCAVADGTLATLTRDGAPMTVAADTTTKGFTLDQYNDGLNPYLGITNGDGAAVLTPLVYADRFRA